MPMSFALAMLAGIGLNILISRNTDRRYLEWAGVGFGVVLALLLGLWALGSHRRNPLSGGQLSSAEASIRAHSFVGPLLCTVIGLAAVGVESSAMAGDRPQRERRHVGGHSVGSRSGREWRCWLSSRCS